MTEFEIERKISQYRNYIDSNNQEIKKLRDKLDELTYTKGKLNDSQNKLYEYRSAQKQIYQRMRNNHPNNRFAAAFSAGMLGCLDGPQSANAHENIETSIQKVKKEMCSIEAEIRDLNSENRRYRNRISDLEYELQQLELRSEE